MHVSRPLKASSLPNEWSIADTTPFSCLPSPRTCLPLPLTHHLSLYVRRPPPSYTHTHFLPPPVSFQNSVRNLLSLNPSFRVCTLSSERAVVELDGTRKSPSPSLHPHRATRKAAQRSILKPSSSCVFLVPSPPHSSILPSNILFLYIPAINASYCPFCIRRSFCLGRLPPSSHSPFPPPPIVSLPGIATSSAPRDCRRRS